MKLKQIALAGEWTPEKIALVVGLIVVLFGLDGKELCRFDVHLGYTKQDKYEPFNIQQKAEAEAYKTFIEGFVREVNGN